MEQERLSGQIPRSHCGEPRLPGRLSGAVNFPGFAPDSVIIRLRNAAFDRCCRRGTAMPGTARQVPLSAGFAPGAVADRYPGGGGPVCRRLRNAVVPGAIPKPAVTKHARNFLNRDSPPSSCGAGLANDSQAMLVRQRQRLARFIIGPFCRPDHNPPESGLIH